MYDEVVSASLERSLKAFQPQQFDLRDISEDSDIDEQLVALVRDAARIAISSRKKSDQKLALAESILHQLAGEGVFDEDELQLRPQLLRQISATANGQVLKLEPPRGSLLSSQLIANAHGENILDHLSSEFQSADRIDLLCSFIKLSGLDRVRGLIERHCSRGRKLRVLTTTYMRATDPKAIEVLHRLGAEIRISYDESHTRLHAKAWIFHRESAYSTAYVGSSNLSHAAQTEGLEWNVRVAEAEQPDLLQRMVEVFDSYWHDPDKFEHFDGGSVACQRLRRSLAEPERQGGRLTFKLEPKDWQKPILRELTKARSVGRHKNLVVAATGTGKTLIAAFDFECLFGRGDVKTLLFVAHRKEILEQAREAFRHVLQRPSFGELWVDGKKPADWQHVFASIQSLTSDPPMPAHFQYVVVDEVHHAAAKSYDALLSELEPLELVGLTATPERADGRLYEKHFPRPYVGNLRLWDAIPHVLVPFRYFVLDTEGVDLASAKWNGGYVDSDLSQRLITAADLWIRTMLRALRDHVARPERIRALAFCVDKAHASVVADRLSRDLGLSARALTDETPSDQRCCAKEDLLSGRVQVLCVVDLFNEGVDIPDVNTLFLLRPTESATVFVQQFGRGLRRSRDKDLLTVFDLTGRQHLSFRFDRQLRALLGHTPRELRAFVEKGLGRLPSGCVIHFEERRQHEILESLKRAVPTDVRGMRELLREHSAQGWTLGQFLEETEIDLFDLYRDGRSWSSLRQEAGLETGTTDELERSALKNVQKLLEVDDLLRLELWHRLIEGEAPQTEAERRLAAMLMVCLYGPIRAAHLDRVLEQWRGHGVLRDELRQLQPVLLARAESLPRDTSLPSEVPILLHARYLDLELSVALGVTTRSDGKYRHFYTGVEKVCDGRYDLLLVTLEKGDVAEEHLRYKDFPLNERLFHWQSQASTRQADPTGRRHVEPSLHEVTPLLFVRERRKDGRGVTCAFRFLGAVSPERVHGERPISIEWRLDTPLRSEWVRRWSNVG